LDKTNKSTNISVRQENHGKQDQRNDGRWHNPQGYISPKY
jgi:hypothetical protein